MEAGKLSGEKDFGGKHVTVDVPVMLFEEDGLHYAYMPAFDLTGYDTTKEKAIESLTIVLDEFLRYTLNKNTFFIELKRLGWKVKSKKRPLVAPQMSDMVNTNEQVRDIINSKSFSTSSYQLNVPAFA